MPAPLHRFVPQPEERWDMIELSLEVEADSSEDTRDDRKTSASTGALIIKDTSPHEYMTSVPTAFQLPNILPELDLPDSVDMEPLEEEFDALSEAFANATQADALFRSWLMDAAAYGCSWIQVAVSGDNPEDEPADEASEDGLILFRHNEVQFTGSWQRPGVVRLRLTYRLDDLDAINAEAEKFQGNPIVQLPKDAEELGTFVCWQDWDFRDHTVTLLLEDESVVIPAQEWPTVYGPALVRLAYGIGETPDLRNWPAGLIAPWLPIRKYYLSLLNDLSTYTSRFLNNPTFVLNSVLGPEKTQWVTDYYGTPVIGVEANFFNDAGAPFAYQVPMAPLPAEFYQHLESTKKRLDESSHMSDIMRGQQFRPNTTATEAQAVMEVQSAWLRNQQDIFRDGVERVWRLWACLKGIEHTVTLEIPDESPNSPEMKQKNVELMAKFLALDPAGQIIDPAQVLQEMAISLGLSSKVIRQTPLPPPLSPAPGGPPLPPGATGEQAAGGLPPEIQGVQ